MDAEVSSSQHLLALFSAWVVLFRERAVQLVVNTVEVAVPKVITRSTFAGCPCASGVAVAGLHGSRTVEASQVQLIDYLVDVAATPSSTSVVQKLMEVPQVPFLDRVPDVPVDCWCSVTGSIP